ncbi:MAG: TIGR00282 family metallophosphoesterase [Candidatus Omnitrophota bacterium]
MNILCIGDIVGRAGRNAIIELLPSLKQELSVDFTVVNAENSAAGSGITLDIAEELFKRGCDVLTSGDHIWDKSDIKDYLNRNEKLLRPANFPDGVPGKGSCVVTAPNGVRVGVINLLGRTFMRYNVTCPFKKLEDLSQEIRKETPVIVVDMHAEATSEKVALGFFSDGKVSIVFGTHTHIPTADETVLSSGTAYITDLGMTGPFDSVIGQVKEKIIERFLTSLPHKFEVATGDIRLNGIIVDVDEKTGKARSIKRIQKKL